MANSETTTEKCLNKMQLLVLCEGLPFENRVFENVQMKSKTQAQQKVTD